MTDPSSMGKVLGLEEMDFGKVFNPPFPISSHLAVNRFFTHPVYSVFLLETAIKATLRQHIL